ncbi:hypothetical protein U8527_08835 [Kordia algicida OT-1]|nr:hypothetical protein [Kordia algicida]
MKKLIAILACMSVFACTPTSVDNETEHFGIDKDKVETPTTKGN